MIEIAFFSLSILAVIFAILVITAKNPVHSVLFLVMTFFSIAGHFVLLNAQFIAVVHVIVYAGAIMVLFLFVIMLMNLNKESEPAKPLWLKLSGVITSGLLLLVLTAVFRKTVDKTAHVLPNPDIGLVKNLGMTLFNDFLLPFELSAVLFLTAMVGAVFIGKVKAGN
ncbi:MAG: NADH dehydrogenase [Bacteroidetes bacterium RIFCSPLOWO2_12_FULL_37_12]|nr:MAG: NADH dehydrogenase [Bacteroidetes bacterium RIFCSPLOWO2_12_FULL_37_12]